MKKFQSISDEITALKKPVRIISLVGIGVNLVAVTIFLFFQFGTGGKQIYSSMEACFYGMDAIFNNNPKTEFVGEKVIKDLEKNKVTFEVERIHLVKFVDGFNCDVVSFDPNGFRNYRVALERSNRFEHHYRILDVNERQIESRYQR